MKRKKCPVCGEFLGTNPDCSECSKAVDMIMSEIAEKTKKIDQKKAKEAMNKALKFIDTLPGSFPNNLFKRFEILVMMLKDYIEGRYKKVPWSVIAAVVFAILYVINPYDLIPDFIPGIGWIDDALVVGLIFEAIEIEIKRYCKWKNIKLD